MRFDGRVRRHTVGFAVITTVLMSPVTLLAAESPFTLGGDAFYLVDDNISKAQFDGDREEDESFTVTGNAGYTFDLSYLTAITVTGTVSAEEYMDFDGLSNTEAGVTGDFRFQTRSAFGAPLYSVFLRATEADFETDNRDGTTIELGFSSTKRLTDKLTGTLGLTASQREAEGEVFDLERVRYFGNIDWRLNDRVALYSTLSYIDGDVFSTATSSAQALPIIERSDAIEPDNAFGGIANRKLAYRLDADTYILRLGVNIAINQSASIDISVDELQSNAAGPVEYDLTSIAIGGLFRF